MKVKLLWSLLLFSGVVLAQPELSSVNFRTIGDSVHNIKVNAASLDPGSSGANVTWDFSTLDSTGQNFRWVVDPKTTPYASTYPKATTAERIKNGSSADLYQYYIEDQGAFHVIGTSGGSIDSTIFSNDDEVWTMPITYQKTHFDTAVSKVYIGSMVMRVRYGRHSEVDGYGTLKLPNGTYNNVLRYKTIAHTTDSITVGMNTIVYQYYTEEYFWASADYSPYLFYLETKEIKNGVNTGSAPMAHYCGNPKVAGGSTAVPNFSKENTNLIYPNPFKESTSVRIQNNGSTLIVYDALGREVKKAASLNEGLYILDRESLDKGLYFYQIISAGKMAQGKMIVE